jgi:cysteinyl-tRNA synthetase
LPRYGALANRSLDEMIAGARVDVAPYKRDVTDFVLWKPAKPGEPSWPSPSGIKVEGRPGWHIECSAMAWKHLGERFDIHGGGIDLVFPHHENELAQTCCVFHEARMANVWMHNGFLQVEGDKMSKSAGNFVTIRELLADWPGEALRFNMLRTHYRSPIDWTRRGIEESVNALDDFRRQAMMAAISDEGTVSEGVREALKDDLNTPKAIAELHVLANAARDGDFSASRNLLATCKFLGLDPGKVNAEDIVRRQYGTVDTFKIDSLVSSRAAARARKDFKESDRIRDELATMGIAIKDGKDPATGEPTTTWEIAR